MESLISGLIGAFIGAGASVATVWIQSNAQAKRDRLRLVMELALEDHKSSIDLARASGRKFSLPPVALYLHYHLELSKLMEEGEITSEKLEALTRKNRAINSTIKKMQSDRMDAENQ